MSGLFFKALIALAGLKQTLEEQSCYGNGASGGDSGIAEGRGENGLGVNRRRRWRFYGRRADESNHPGILPLFHSHKCLSGVLLGISAPLRLQRHPCAKLTAWGGNIPVIMGAQVTNVHGRGAVSLLSMSACGWNEDRL